jgi:hypothetical protein
MLKYQRDYAKSEATGRGQIKKKGEFVQKQTKAKVQKLKSNASFLMGIIIKTQERSCASETNGKLKFKTY